LHSTNLTMHSIFKSGNRFRKLFIQNEQLIYSVCLSKCFYSLKTTNNAETHANKSEKFHTQKKHFQEANASKQNSNTVVVTQEEVNFLDSIRPMCMHICTPLFLIIKSKVASKDFDF
jgi:hypothetical protein